jgi:hypothetical protein
MCCYNSHHSSPIRTVTILFTHQKSYFTQVNAKEHRVHIMYIFQSIRAVNEVTELQEPIILEEM